MMTKLVILVFASHLLVDLSGVFCQNDTHEVDINNIKEEILKVIDTVTNGELEKAESEFDKKVIIAKKAVEGTSLIVSKFEEVQGISDFLRKGTPTGGVVVSPEDEAKMKGNIKALFEKSDNEDVKSVTDDSQCIVIGSLIKTPPDESMLDMKDIVKKVKNGINTHTNGAYGQAAEGKDKEKVVMDAMLKDTGVAACSEEDSKAFVEGLRQNKLEGIAGITADQETKIKENIGHFCKGDYLLELLTDESRYNVMAIVLAGDEVKVLDTQVILQKVIDIIDTKTGGAVKAAASVDEKKALVAKLLSEGTPIPLDADTIVKILIRVNGESVEGVSPEDIEKVENNTKALFDSEGADDEVKSVLPESRMTIMGHLLQNGLNTTS